MKTAVVHADITDKLVICPLKQRKINKVFFKNISQINTFAAV